MVLAWTILIGLTAVVWTLRHLLIFRVNSLYPTLKADAAALPPDKAPRVSVLVAAKDEESNIGRCVESLLRQDYPDYSVIAINDRSDDRTGPILDEIASGNARLTALHVKELREGWFGKNNAMREGVDHSDGQWLCFTDADCTFTSPTALSTAVRYAQENKIDFLSVLPILEAHSVLEQMIQPACGGILLIWFDPLRVNRASSKAAYANGAFMLMSRHAYDTIGGHEPVKTEVNEDMHMAAIAKRNGLRLRVVPNDDLYRVRMYATFTQMWRGWSRIFYGCFGTYRKLILSMIAVMITGILPSATFVTTGLMLWCGARFDGLNTLFAMSAASSALQLTVMIRYYRATKIPAWLAPTFPLAALLGVGMLVSAIRRLSGRGTTTWRGTTYRGSSVVRR